MRTPPLRRVLVTLAFFALFCIGLLIMDQRSLLDPIRSGVGEVLSPITTRLSAVGRPAEPSGSTETQLATAVAENDALRAENARLRGQVEEYSVLQQTHDIEQEYQDRAFLPARVVGTDPSGLQQAIIIDKGTADGLQVGMAVVDPNYYVGQIISVEEHRAKVLLITDGSASVGARLYDQRADGVCYGQSGTGGFLTLRHVDKDVVPGNREWIVTSDIFDSETALVPGNILIGWVVGEPRLEAQTDQLEITVQPAADFTNMETVWIVVPK